MYTLNVINVSVKWGQVKADPRQEIISYFIMKHFSLIQPFMFRSKPTELHDLRITLSDSKSEVRKLPSRVYTLILNVFLFKMSNHIFSNHLCILFSYPIRKQFWNTYEIHRLKNARLARRLRFVKLKTNIITFLINSFFTTLF